MTRSIAYLSRTAGRHDDSIVAALRSSGDRVEVLAPGRPEDAIDALRSGPAPDLVVAGPLTDALPLATKAAVAPVLGMSWAFDVLIETRDPAVRDGTARALDRTRWVHTDCAAVRAEVVALGFPEDRVSVAAWGIDLGFFRRADGTRREVRRRLGVPDDAVVVLSNRSWEPVYDIETVVRGVARARRRHPELLLVLAGAGSQADAIAGEVADHELGDACRTPGVLGRPELLAWLQAADVFVSAAHSDGASLSLLEALACEVTPVVADVGGNAELIGSDDVGRLFRVGDAEHLADRLEEVLAPDFAQAGHGERLRARARERGDGPRNTGLLLAAVRTAAVQP